MCNAQLQLVNFHSRIRARIVLINISKTFSISTTMSLYYQTRDPGLQPHPISSRDRRFTAGTVLEEKQLLWICKAISDSQAFYALEDRDYGVGYYTMEAQAMTTDLKPDSSVISIFDDGLEGRTKTTSPSRHARARSEFFFCLDKPVCKPGNTERANNSATSTARA